MNGCRKTVENKSFRLLFVADLHGATPCAEQVPALMEAEGADYLVLLGDLLSETAL